MGRFDIFPIFIATFASRRVTLIATHSKSQKQTRLPIRYLYFILPFKPLINKEVIKVFQNYYKTLDNGTIEKGFFNLDVDKKQLTILNANILQGAAYADDGAAGSYYVITKLTEAEMTLARQGDGWQNTWVFKAK